MLLRDAVPGAPLDASPLARFQPGALPAPAAVVAPAAIVQGVVYIPVPGLQGLPGSVAGTLPYSSITGATYIHTQSTASALWQIPHNLGRPLKWTVTDSAGTVIVPGQRLINLNTQHLTFGAPTSGVAYGS